MYTHTEQTCTQRDSRTDIGIEKRRSNADRTTGAATETPTHTHTHTVA